MSAEAQDIIKECVSRVGMHSSTHSSTHQYKFPVKKDQKDRIYTISSKTAQPLSYQTTGRRSYSGSYKNRFMATSLCLPKSLQEAWELQTKDIKGVPPFCDLIVFVEGSGQQLEHSFKAEPKNDRHKSHGLLLIIVWVQMSLFFVQGRMP